MALVDLRAPLVGILSGFCIAVVLVLLPFCDQWQELLIAACCIIPVYGLWATQQWSTPRLRRFFKPPPSVKIHFAVEQVENGPIFEEFTELNDIRPAAPLAESTPVKECTVHWERQPDSGFGACDTETVNEVDDDKTLEMEALQQTKESTQPISRPSVLVGVLIHSDEDGTSAVGDDCHADCLGHHKTMVKLPETETVYEDEIVPIMAVQPIRASRIPKSRRSVRKRIRMSITRAFRLLTCGCTRPQYD